MSETEPIIQILAAVVFGGLIGLEREVRDKPAGFRTIILICVGACVFTIISRLAGRPEYESTRIAAQIVTGIGFLGAGAILRDRGSVMGMTTAATIWAVAAIGMAVGFGHLRLAVMGTAAILVALLIFDVFERWIGDLRDIQDYYIAAENTDDTLDRINTLMEEANLRIRKRLCYEEGSSLVVHIIAMGAKTNHEQLQRKLIRSSEYTLRRS